MQYFVKQVEILIMPALLHLIINKDNTKKEILTLFLSFNNNYDTVIPDDTATPYHTTPLHLRTSLHHYHTTPLHHTTIQLNEAYFVFYYYVTDRLMQIFRFTCPPALFYSKENHELSNVQLMLFSTYQTYSLIVQNNP